MPRCAELAEEVIAGKVNVFIVSGPPALRAARAVTTVAPGRVLRVDEVIE